VSHFCTNLTNSSIHPSIHPSIEDKTGPHPSGEGRGTVVDVAFGSELRQVAAADNGCECEGSLEVKEVVVDAFVEPWLGPAWAFTRRDEGKGEREWLPCLYPCHACDCLKISHVNFS
jgi:hypothetical protein